LSITERKASAPCSRRIRLASGGFNKATRNDLEKGLEAARLQPRRELACVLTASIIVVADDEPRERWCRLYR
jgi:hypothetical protein